MPQCFETRTAVVSISSGFPLPSLDDHAGPAVILFFLSPPSGRAPSFREAQSPRGDFHRRLPRARSGRVVRVLVRGDGEVEISSCSRASGACSVHRRGPHKPAIARRLAHAIGAPFRRAKSRRRPRGSQRRPQPGTYGPHSQRPDDRPDARDVGGRARIRPPRGTGGARESNHCRLHRRGSGETDSSGRGRA